MVGTSRTRHHAAGRYDVPARPGGERDHLVRPRFSTSVTYPTTGRERSHEIAAAFLRCQWPDGSVPISLPQQRTTDLNKRCRQRAKRRPDTPPPSPSVRFPTLSATQDGCRKLIDIGRCLTSWADLSTIRQDVSRWWTCGQQKRRANVVARSGSKCSGSNDGPTQSRIASCSGWVGSASAVRNAR